MTRPRFRLDRNRLVDLLRRRSAAAQPRTSIHQGHVVIEIDITAFERSMRQLRNAVADLAPSLLQIATRWEEITNGPVRIAGLEARCWVRAGLDPTFADPQQLTELIEQILEGNDLDFAFTSLANRRRVAQAAIRGWSTSYRGTASADLVARVIEVVDGPRP